MGAPPGAAQAPDAQTTNIPYTAWAGTQLRLVKCDDELIGVRDSGLDVVVESWSGDPNLRPTAFESSVTKLGGIDGRCARANVVSLGDGLARIKLKAFEGARATEVLEHQFLAIWLRLGTPAIDEVGAADPTAGPAGSASEVGDPAGDGAFTPSSNNGRVQVKITGSFPHPLGPGGRFTLPNDWATIANALATSSDPVATSHAMRWDIHDDALKTEQHVAGECPTGLPTVTVDAVDNCRGPRDVAGYDADFGPFSRVFGDRVNGAEGQGAGPFDPLRPQTLLSDGKLDAGDAPMPAARVDVEIAPNTAGGINGAGALQKSDKTEVYSRDGNGTATPHNLYAPYYKQWLPGTAADAVNPRSSGTDWSHQNNFPFVPVTLYDNWDAYSLDYRPTVDTACNRLVAFPGGASSDEPRTTPVDDPAEVNGSVRRVAVATDEHGEAQVEYEPYAGGFYYDNVGAIINDNRGCDLQDVDVLGTSAITATAKYPGQPVDFPSTVSATLTKTVGNEFDKSMSYYPKGAGTANANARILVAHGQDVDGTPFAGERVCFYVDDEADSYRLFSGTTGPATARFAVDSDQAPTPSGLDPDVRCAFLDENGNAALEVFNSDPQSINVIAEYVDEGLLRDRDIEFGTPGSGDPTPPPNTGGEPSTPPANNPGTSAPSKQQVVKTAGPSLVPAVTTARPASISKARIKKTKKGRFLMVRVTSDKDSATLSVRLVAKKTGKVYKKVSKSIATNSTVKVMKIPKRARTARVALSS
ncbi:MAG: hypothetical protein ABW060_05555 [Solirubrobacteraceae bacterium]